tara:strand:- start:39 stop:296 length:258 start_codon:yes stop_codon:yes gene_type:complete
MTLNKEDLKNKIIYRASYRGTKEMDILMIGFVKSIISNLDIKNLNILNEFVNYDDEMLISIKKNEKSLNTSDKILLNIIDKFKKY